MNTKTFEIEQIAIRLNPDNEPKAMKLLALLGMTDWIKDSVVAEGTVHETPAINRAELAFAYPPAGNIASQIEFERIKYVTGDNWLDSDPFRPGGAIVSHIAMHVTKDDLIDWKVDLQRMGIKIAQSVETISHSNPAVPADRFYQYMIFSTFELIGFDLKFIVRKNKMLNRRIGQRRVANLGVPVDRRLPQNGSGRRESDL